MTPADPHGVHHAMRRYLLDGESIVTAVHQHWAKVAEPVASAVLGLVLVVWISSVAPAGLSRVADVLWWAWFVLVARMIWLLLQWRYDWFVATDKRLLLTYGLITRKVAMMPLAKVTDMSYSRSPVGRVIGYGRFTMESAGQDQALHEINWLPDPDRTYRAICAEIFGVDDRDRTVRPADEDDDLPSGPAADLDDTGPGWAVPDEEAPPPIPVPGTAGHSTQIPIRGPGRARAHGPNDEDQSSWSVHRSPDPHDADTDENADDTGPITPWRPDPTL